jgi:hypothetical protein
MATPKPYGGGPYATPSFIGWLIGQPHCGWGVAVLYVYISFKYLIFIKKILFSYDVAKNDDMALTNGMILDGKLTE